MAVFVRTLGIIWAVIPGLHISFFPFTMLFILLQSILLGIAWWWELKGGVIIALFGIFMIFDSLFDILGFPQSPYGTDLIIVFYLIFQIIIGILFAHVGWRKKISRRTTGLLNG